MAFVDLMDTQIDILDRIEALLWLHLDRPLPPDVYMALANAKEEIERLRVENGVS